MSKSYTELEAWGIFVGALIIGIVVTSMFWAFITKPDEIKQLEEELENISAKPQIKVNADIPNDFLTFCNQIGGIPNWDNLGFRQCAMKRYSEKNLIVMNLLCKKYNLTLSYGSFGVKCEGSI